jgi:hypothetical protein
MKIMISWFVRVEIARTKPGVVKSPYFYPVQEKVQRAPDFNFKFYYLKFNQNLGSLR